MNNKAALWLLGVVSFLSAALVLFLSITFLSQQKQRTVNVNQPVASNALQRDDTANWQTYRNEQYGFEFKYPAEWSVEAGTFKNERGQVVISIAAANSSLIGISYCGARSLSEAPDQRCEFPTVDSKTIEIDWSVDNKAVASFEINGSTYFVSFDKNFVATETIRRVLSTFKFTSGNVAGAETCKQLVNQAEQYFGTGASYPRELLLTECKKYLAKTCTSDKECGSFPCINNTCFIKPCERDQGCPNRKCGLYATPAPRFCTTTDIK